jgi:hypothetical protein
MLKSIARLLPFPVAKIAPVRSREGDEAGKMMRLREPADWRDEDLLALGAQPLRGRRAVARRRVPWIRISLTSAALIALIAVHAPDRASRDGVAPHSLLGAAPELLTPPSPWRELATSDLEIGIEDERLAGLPLSHAARAHEDGTLQDVIEIGAFRSTQPHLRFLLERGTENDLPGRSFFVDLAVRAAHAGLAVARSLPEEPLATRDDRYEIAQVWLENGRTRTCLAFRTIDVKNPARQVGWLCGNGVTREDLACAIEGLALRHIETGLLLSGPRTPDVEAACLRGPMTTGREMPPQQSATTGPTATSPTTLASGTLFPPLPPRRPVDR